MVAMQGAILVDGDGLDNLVAVLKQVKPGAFAPANIWTTAHRTSLETIAKRKTLMTLDGLRRAHMLIVYGAFKGYKWEEASWATKRKEAIKWLEAHITELLQAGVKSRVK